MRKHGATEHYQEAPKGLCDKYQASCIHVALMMLCNLHSARQIPPTCSGVDELCFLKGIYSHDKNKQALWLLLNTDVSHSCKSTPAHQQICGGDGGAVLRDFIHLLGSGCGRRLLCLLTDQVRWLLICRRRVQTFKMTTSKKLISSKYNGFDW